MKKSIEKRQTILKIIEQDPGAGFIDIQKITGYANGVLSHHLKILYRDGEIRIKRERRKIWVFPSYLDSNEYMPRIFLRKETCKKILLFLLKNKTSTFSQIRNSIEKSPAMTSHALKMLSENRLIKKIHGFPHQYTLEDPNKIAILVHDIEISKIDSLKERFTDTFSYY